MAGDQSGLLPEPVVAGTGQRSATGAAQQVLASGTSGVVGGGHQKAWSAGARTNTGGRENQEARQEEATASIQETGADRGGQHGEQRDLRLAGGGRSAASRLGPRPT